MQITNHNGREYVTDSLTDTRTDAVFPLFSDESLYVADHIEVRSGDRVLDIGTGSGILAISAAAAAVGKADVVAVDIQPRALRFAEFNAYINGVHIELLKSDGLDEVDGTFDLILFNPPFNPAPEFIAGRTFSHGGDDGMRVIKKVFPGLSQVVNRRGHLRMVTFGLGTSSGPSIFGLIKDHLGDRHPRVDFTYLYPPLDHVATTYFERIFGPEHRAWCQKFHKYPVAYYMYLSIDLDAVDPGFYERPLAAKLEKSEYTGDWEGRIERLRAIFFPERPN